MATTVTNGSVEVRYKGGVSPGSSPLPGVPGAAHVPRGGWAWIRWVHEVPRGLVEEKVLEEMFRAKGGHLVPAFEPWEGKPRAILHCPVCQGAMAQVGLGHVPVDRCASHGLWFARDELEEALRDRPRSRAPREGLEVGESGIPQIVAAVIELILYLF